MHTKSTLLIRFDMYLPKHFAVDDPAILAQLIAEYPLATLVGNLDNHLEVNHLPLMLTRINPNFMVTLPE